jgi:hypothetical protein
LLLNSIYGKTILKPIETNVKLINKVDSDECIYRNKNPVEKSEEVDNSKFVKGSELKNTNKHYNPVHLDCNILNMSKRIMSEVMYLAEDNGVTMLYQDTDSNHMRACEMGLLYELFKEKYGRDLVKKRLCQFRSDFLSMDGTESFAAKSVFCAKKHI